MKQSIFKDRYPVWTLELDKNEIDAKNIDAVVEHFTSKIEAHPIATLIAVFNHMDHTKSLEGAQINPDIIDIKNVIFCFGKEIPNTKVAAVRPRSIAVCELADKFLIEFLEAPNETMHSIMEDWAKALKK